MTTIQQRQAEITASVAAAAYKQPVMDTGFLFEGDVRDNFYYASYLFAVSVDPEIAFDGDRSEAKEKAERILQHLLQIQDQDPSSPTYGHWPLNLRPIPQEASKNTLPVELMGSLMVYFVQRYEEQLSDTLRSGFEATLRHIYNSNFYRQPISSYSHHEAKYTAAKLIFGQRYEDAGLIQDGLDSLRKTLDRVTTRGMSEYSALPWFWHWVQAFTCAWKLTNDNEIRAELAQMLDYLWNVRATYYLGGAWVGPHSRIWPHDMPKDTNVLHDYVQFGDFELPALMPRTEYAGFLAYEAPAQSIQTALHRSSIPVEIKRQIPKQISQAQHEQDVLHSYVYITESFAMGGIWERVREFDNEQHRWDVALPLDHVQGVNHAYFFHPDLAQPEGDLRHQSEYTEVLFHRNVIMATYDIPETQPDYIKGCLPLGDWIVETGGLFGRVGNVYMAVYIQQPFIHNPQEDRVFVTSQGRTHAVVIECIDQANAESLGVRDTHHFAEMMKSKQPTYSENNTITYTSSTNQTLLLNGDPTKEKSRLVDGESIDFSSYTIA